MGEMAANGMAGASHEDKNEGFSHAANGNDATTRNLHDTIIKKLRSLKSHFAKSPGDDPVAFSCDSGMVEISTKDGDGESDHQGSVSLNQENLLIASALVLDAKEGRHSDFEMKEKSVKLYLMYHHRGLRLALFFFVVVHHLLAIFEEPAVPGCQLPYVVTCVLELICLAFYIFRLAHLIAFMNSGQFFRDMKNLLVMATIFVTLIDMICYVAFMNTGHENEAYRWSRPLRPIFIVNFSENRQVRRAFRNIRKTLPDILNVLILFFLSICLFSLMAHKLFWKRKLFYPDNTPYFANYWDIIFDLYVLVTTANNPDVMMPAYDNNRAFAVFFVAYLLICLYIFMNIILAVIYNNYRKHLKNEVKNVLRMKRQSLSQAFDLLKVTIDGEEVITYKHFTALMRLIPPIRSKMMITVLWFVLDNDADNKICKTEFNRISDLLNVRVTEFKDRKTLLERLFPRLYNSNLSKSFRKIVATKYFRYFFDFLILINAFFIAFDINDVEWVLLGLFMFEIIAKFYTFGSREFFRKMWNVFDFIIIGSAVIASIVQTIDGDDDLKKTQTLDVLMVLRVLRLIKIIGGIERFRVVVVTIMNLGPSILTYGGVLFVVYYMFAIIGMELFQNKIQFYSYKNETDANHLYCGNAALKGSAFYESHYCSNNFNNILNSLMVLFELMVVNQWHVIASGFSKVTSKGARLYFVLFHLTCVIIVLNIFTAFVLEAFILEYSFSKSKSEGAIERKIEEMGLRLGRKRKATKCKENDKVELVDTSGIESDLEVDSDHNPRVEPEDVSGVPRNRTFSLPDISSETGIRFDITKSRNVENLLQRMFENELEIEEQEEAREGRHELIP